MKLNRSGNLLRGVVTAALLCALALSGCQRFRLPAIDPSGDRIFLPTTTEVNTPNFFPEPVFTPGITPPPCEPPFVTAAPDRPVAVAPTSRGAVLPRGQAGTLQLTPTRIVAPIGSEVVLLAGLCGTEGNFVAKQPLEWTLSQESVGHLVEVGHGGRQFWDRLHHNKTRKLSNNFAIGRTSSSDDVIDRGTVSQVDDVWVQRGQGWVSVTSPTEGTSHISCLSPQTENWQQRRQTAAIHWIDAQWALPGVSNGPIGQPQALTTTVTRASNGSPIAGWIVRYEIVQTSGAIAFSEGGGMAIEVPTDAAGNAPATLISTSPGFASAQVNVQIIRPAQASGDLPRLAVGSGATSVTWSAAGLAVNITGPTTTVGVDSVVAYQIQVSNPGDRPARNVVVIDSPSAGLEYLASEPVGRPLGNQVEWSLGEIAARTSRVITVNYRAKQRGQHRYCASATANDNLKAEHCVDTIASVPALAVDMIVDPAQVNVGEQCELQIILTNNGDQPLRDIVLHNTSDVGLEEATGRSSPIEKNDITFLDVGKQHRIKLVFNVTRPGQLCHTLRVSAAGLNPIVERRCVTAIDVRPDPAPAVEVRLTGTPQQLVNKNAEYSFDITNTGNVPLTNVQVQFNFSPSMFPSDATHGHGWHQGGGLVWEKLMPQLGPGESQPIRVLCKCLKADPAAVAQVVVTTDQRVGDSKRVTTEIVPLDDPAPAEDPMVVEPPVTGDLEVTVADLADPIRTAVRPDDRETTTYLITVKNNRNVSDKNIQISFEIPDGMTHEKTGHPLLPGFRPGGSVGPRKFDLRMIRELRPGETYPPFRIEVRGDRAGMHQFRVQVKSQRTPLKEVAEDTTVE